MQTNFISPVPLVQPAAWVAVTPNDTTDLPIPTLLNATLTSGVCKGLYIDQAGTLTFIGANNLDADKTTINVAAGTTIGGFFRRVLATGTSATGISALY